jgi:hypothetical protein
VPIPESHNKEESEEGEDSAILPGDTKRRLGRPVTDKTATQPEATARADVQNIYDVSTLEELPVSKRKARERPAKQGPSIGLPKKRGRPPGSKNKKPAKGKAAKKAAKSNFRKKLRSEVDSEDGSSEESEEGGGGGGGQGL